MTPPKSAATHDLQNMKNRGAAQFVGNGTR